MHVSDARFQSLSLATIVDCAAKYLAPNVRDKEKEVMHHHLESYKRIHPILYKCQACNCRLPAQRSLLPKHQIREEPLLQSPEQKKKDLSGGPPLGVPIMAPLLAVPQRLSQRRPGIVPVVRVRERHHASRSRERRPALVLRVGRRHARVKRLVDAVVGVVVHRLRLRLRTVNNNAVDLGAALGGRRAVGHPRLGKPRPRGRGTALDTLLRLDRDRLLLHGWPVEHGMGRK